MGLVTCKDCGNKVSTSAKSCPSCGAPVKKQYGCGTLLVAIVGILFAITSVVGAGKGTKTGASKEVSVVKTAKKTHKITGKCPKFSEIVRADRASLAKKLGTYRVSSTVVNGKSYELLVFPETADEIVMENGRAQLLTLHCTSRVPFGKNIAEEFGLPDVPPDVSNRIGHIWRNQFDVEEISIFRTEDNQVNYAYICADWCP